ncbi:MAG: hypothetical protein WC429_19740, partial [Verrucomicrobiia bacterium]
INSCAPKEGGAGTNIPHRDLFKEFKAIGFHWGLPEVPEGDQDSAIIKACKDDFTRSCSKSITLFRVLKNAERGLWYYTFEVDDAIDSVIAYAYEIRTRRIVFKFYVPMA